MEVITGQQKIRPGYNQTELGVIPEEWDLKQLKDIVVKVIDNRGKTPPYSNDADIELIETASISFVNRSPDYSKVTKFVTQEVYENWFRAHPKARDILISTVGEYSGASAIMGEDRGTIAQNLVALRINNANSTFVFYWSRSDLFKKQLRQVMMNQAQPSLRVPWLLKFLLPFPTDKNEQATVAEALSAIDSLIEELDKLTAKKRDLKQGAMQQLLTGKKRLPGFSGEWTVKPFADVFSRVNAKEYQIQTSDYQDTGDYPVVDQGKELIIGYCDSSDKRFRCPKDGVIVFGDHTCIVKFVNFDFVVGADGTQILTAKIGQCARFLAFQLEYSGIQTTGYNRHFKFLKERMFSTPPLPEQIAIADVLSDMDADIATLEARRDKTRAIKQGMMQQLLTGNIRLV